LQVAEATPVFCVNCGERLHSPAYTLIDKIQDMGFPAGQLCCSCYRKLHKRTVARPFVINLQNITDALLQASARLLDKASTTKHPVTKRRARDASLLASTTDPTVVADLANTYFSSHPYSGFCVFYLGLCRISYWGQPLKYAIEIRRNGEARYIGTRYSKGDYNALN